MPYLKELKITYQRRRVKDGLINQPVKTSKQVYELFKWMRHETRETAICLHLSPQLRILSYETIGMGDAKHMVLDVQGLFRGAILGLATSIIVIHNHPHGKKKPSPQDIRASEELEKVGKLHNIKLEDFMIIGENGYYSFKERGLL